MIHNDSTPVNYIFHKERPFFLDFELASRHGYFACDLGILCAELKYYFARKGSSHRDYPLSEAKKCLEAIIKYDMFQDYSHGLPALFPGLLPP